MHCVKKEQGEYREKHKRSEDARALRERKEESGGRRLAAER